MDGWLIHLNKWDNIKKHTKTIAEHMRLVKMKITKSRHEKWMKKWILEKRKGFSQEYLADDQ